MRPAPVLPRSRRRPPGSARQQARQSTPPALPAESSAPRRPASRSAPSAAPRIATPYAPSCLPSSVCAQPHLTRPPVRDAKCVERSKSLAAAQGGCAGSAPVAHHTFRRDCCREYRPPLHYGARPAPPPTSRAAATRRHATWPATARTIRRRRAACCAQVVPTRAHSARLLRRGPGTAERPLLAAPRGVPPEPPYRCLALIW